MTSGKSPHRAVVKHKASGAKPLKHNLWGVLFTHKQSCSYLRNIEIDSSKVEDGWNSAVYSQTDALEFQNPINKSEGELPRGILLCPIVVFNFVSWYPNLNKISVFLNIPLN